MNKISLYKISIRNPRSIISYGKTKSIGVNRDSTSRTREGISSGRETLLPYALPCSSSENRWFFGCEGWSTDGYAPVSVSVWVKRYETEGIEGLYTRPGRGRKPIMDSSDEEAVHRAIEQDRQCGARPWLHGNRQQARKRAILLSSVFYQHWRKI